MSAVEKLSGMVPGEVTIEEALKVAQDIMDEEGDLAPGHFYEFHQTQMSAEKGLELEKKLVALRKEHFKKQGKTPPKFKTEELGE